MWWIILIVFPVVWIVLEAIEDMWDRKHNLGLWTDRQTLTEKEFQAKYGKSR